MATTPLSPSFLGKPTEICIVQPPVPHINPPPPSTHSLLDNSNNKKENPQFDRRKAHLALKKQVTNDYRRTLTGLCSLGIGPWRIYTCSPENTTQQTYRGQSTPYSLRFCYAELTGGIIYEVIQPLDNNNDIFQDWLNEHPGGGLHHIAYDCNGIPMAERIAKFRECGLDVVQGGLWKGDIEFAFFESKEAGTFFETITFPEGWDYPEPEEWFPADKAPVAGAA